MISKPIPNFPNYCITPEGIIKNIKTGRILKQSSNRVKLDNGEQLQSFRVKKLMYELFVQNGVQLLPGEIVVHKDGDENNFSLDNLVKTTRARLRRTVGEPVLDKSKKWVVVRDFPDYLVSDCGDVFSKKTNAMLSQHLGDSNYYRVVVCNTKKYNRLVHILVFYSFNPEVERTKDRVVDHIDRNSKNNKLTNLRLATLSENAKNIEVKTKSVSITQYNMNYGTIKIWNDIADIVASLGYKRRTILDCCNGYRTKAYGYMWKKKTKKTKIINITEFKKIITNDGCEYTNYMINRNGIVINNITNKIMTTILSNGYQIVKIISIDGVRKAFKVHRLVATIFLQNENKLNNHVSNLEWCTPKENTTHSTGKKVIQIDPKTNKKLRKFKSLADASRYLTGETGHGGPISNVCNGKSKLSYGYKWKWSKIV